MDWLVWLCLIIIICYSSYPSRVRKLEKKLKRLEKVQKGDCEMSKIINELVGKKCNIETSEALAFIGSTNFQCTVLDADDEWIKFTYFDKKNVVKTKILRIESIDNVEIIDE